MRIKIHVIGAPQPLYPGATPSALAWTEFACCAYSYPPWACAVRREPRIVAPRVRRTRGKHLSHTLADVWGLFVIAIVVVASHVRAVRHGMCFDEPSWLFHFGHRVVAGDVPYRDFVFSDGPLPLYVEAGFQSMFGAKYYASLYAALLIKVLRVFVVWALARRIADGRVAALLAAFCAIDPMFSDAYHSSSAYTALFITSAGSWLVLAARCDGAGARMYLALAGLSMALLVATSPGTGLAASALMLVASTAFARQADVFSAYRLGVLWGAFVLGVIAVGVALAAQGALSAAIQHLVCDAWTKRAGFGLDSLFAAASPALVVAATVIAAARDREVASSTLGILLAPVAMLLGLGMRYGGLDPLIDVPCALFAVATAVAICAPSRLRVWFGVEPVVSLGLGTLPLAAGLVPRPEASVLATGALLFVLASSTLSRMVKTWLCATLVVAAAIHASVTLYEDRQMFARSASADGTRSETVQRARNRALHGLWVSPARKRSLALLEANVPAGRSCFVHGNLPVLYTLLRCHNPTRVDATDARFITTADAEAALDVLRRAPPDFLVVHERAASLHLAVDAGLRALLPQYESIGTVGEGLGLDLWARAAAQGDAIDAARVYRRRGAR